MTYGLMTKRGLIAALAFGAVAAWAGACTPTLRVKGEPLHIYAKLDAHVRIRLDKEVQALISQNPDLF